MARPAAWAPAVVVCPAALAHLETHAARTQW
jgi:hypothetical protein